MRLLILFLIVSFTALGSLEMLSKSTAIFLLAVLSAWLVLEVRALRRRLLRLEAQLDSQAPAKEEAVHQILPLDLESAPEPSNAASPHPPCPVSPASFDQNEQQDFVEKQPKHPLAPNALWGRLHRLFFASNPVLKIGIIILFFGVSFLLKYAAQRNLIPIELRLAGVALGGLALIGLGWRLRHRQPGYGLGLEGAGIGLLYLTTYAAQRLYNLLPVELAMAVMVGLVAFSCLLAILQDSRAMAASGSLGGFLAPVLLSTGSGSHVHLFAYYALLNCSILTIAWFKAWRELNLIGFFFTFGLGTLWGIFSYRSDYFATTEFFLLLFFVIYGLIAVLHAHRQPLRLRGFIDGPLVFGLPLVTTGLQAYLVRDIPFGLAYSVLGFGLFYLGLARLLWHRLVKEMRLLTEAYLSLGVVFASLAIPLGLDAQWTTAAWALEGAAMVWVGVRQRRRTARLFGLLLQLGAGLMLTGAPDLNPESLPFANHLFLGCALIAASGLVSSYWQERMEPEQGPKNLENRLAWLYLVWGLLWWYGGGLSEIQGLLPPSQTGPGYLLFACATVLALGLLVERLKWSLLVHGLIPLLPIMVLVLADSHYSRTSSPLLTGYGALAWPLAFVLQYTVLARYSRHLPARLIPVWHCLCLWLLILVTTTEAVARLEGLDQLASAWSLACWGLIPLLFLTFLTFSGNRLPQPMASYLGLYQGTGADIPMAALLLWFLVSLTSDGNPDPLPYLPLINPLELTESVLVLVFGLRLFRYPPFPALGGPWNLILVSAIAFLLLNAIVARSVHAFAGIAYQLFPLFSSMVLQASLAALWSLLALTLTVWGARRRQRTLWLCGAGLLAMVVAKLMLIDLSGTGTIGRIVSFLVVGLLMLLIGYLAPLPPQTKESS